MEAANKDLDDNRPRTEEPQTIVSHQSRSNYQVQLQKFLAKPVTKRHCKIAEETKEIFGSITEITDWPDTKPAPLSTYYIDTEKSNRDIILLGLRTMSEMYTTIRRSTVINLLVLASNLKTPQGEKIFPSLDVAELIDFTKQASVSSITDGAIRTISGSIPQPLYEITDPAYSDVFAAAYCFWAASFMRLYTKSADNFAKTHKHLSDRFKNFYLENFPFNNASVDKEQTEAVRLFLEFDERLKNTFYVFVYVGQDSDLGKNLKEFLYENHIKYTGLHSIAMFLMVMELTKMSERQIIDILYVPKIQRELISLKNVMNNLIKADDYDKYERQMWKYARIFNKDFYTSLQTKKAPYFIAVLAYWVKDLTRDGNQNVLDIAQLKSLGDNEMMLAKAHAAKAQQVAALD